MQARVETSIDGGSVEIVYTTDPKYSDGLTQTELAETILGLIPAIISAVTYPTFDASNVADTLRNVADVWDPLPDPWKAEHYEPSEQSYEYWENEH